MRKKSSSAIWIAVLLFTPLLSAQSLPGTAMGRITSIEGEPLSGVRVIALDTSYPRTNIASQTETDNEGRFRLGAIPPGEYFIVADPFRRPSYYPGSGNRDASTRVTLSAGETVRNLDFKHVPASGVIQSVRTPIEGGPRFSGVIHDPLGDPLPNITVALSDVQTKAQRWTVTDARGMFQFSNLKPGEFLVRTFSPEYEWNRGFGAGEDLMFSADVAAGLSLWQQLGVRGFANPRQRPDLYAPLPGEAGGRSISLAEARFWNLHNLDTQEQPGPGNTRGSVAVQVMVDSEGKLEWIRAASHSDDPELARIVIETVGQWTFIGYRMTADPLHRFTRDGTGEPVAFYSTLTFSFSPNN
jgi:hypothetical protein